MKGPAFVIGTGRSGSNWLGRILGSHPGIRATVEKEPIFGLALRMARGETALDAGFPQLVSLYREQIALAGEKLYADKSHQNIWFVERLKRSFPGSLFIEITREPCAVVVSMIRHGTIVRAHKRSEFAIPNRFLGITAENAERYRWLPVHIQSALRIKSHRDRRVEVAAFLGPDFLVIEYEALVARHEETLAQLQRFLGLSEPFTPAGIVPGVGSRGVLTEDQCAEIRQIVEGAS